MTLFLSQNTVVPHPFDDHLQYLSICNIEEGSFSKCSDTGEVEYWPYGFGISPAWLAVHDSAKKLWKGKIKIENGVTLGVVYKPGEKEKQK